MHDHDNVSSHRKLHEAFAAGDVDKLNALLGQGVQWHIAGRSLNGGTRDGREAVMAFLGQVQQRSNGSLSLANHVFMGAGDRTVALFDMTATQGDKELSVKICEVLRWEDGIIAEHWGSAYDQYAYDDFWS